MSALLPRLPGSYALLIPLEEPLPEVEVGRLGRVNLAAGSYIYCGSAQGGGGLAARLGRHLRREKARRWHIDALTATARPSWLLWQVEATPQTPGLECVWSQRLLSRGFVAPIPGFGSSDCRHRCPAHLLHTAEIITGPAVAKMMEDG